MNACCKSIILVLYSIMNVIIDVSVTRKIDEEHKSNVKTWNELGIPNS